jgi:hypothetical protein
MYHLCDWQRAIQCGPLKVRNRSQAYTVHGQISTMRTCDGQRVKEFQHYLVKDLNPPFDAVALRRGASSMMRSDCGRLLYVGFFFCFGSTVRLHTFSVLNVNVVIISTIACDNMIFLLSSLSPTLVRGPTT